MKKANVNNGRIELVPVKNRLNILSTKITMTTKIRKLKKTNIKPRDLPSNVQIRRIFE